MYRHLDPDKTRTWWVLSCRRIEKAFLVFTMHGPFRIRIHDLACVLCLTGEAFCGGKTKGFTQLDLSRILRLRNEITEKI